MIQIELDGAPTPWAAPLRNGNKTYDPKSKEKDWAKWQIKSQYREELIGGPVHVDFTFYLPIPKRTSGIRRRQMLNHIILPTTKPDTTNLQKLYEDCLKGIVLTDDNLVTDISSRKRYSEKPGLLIRIYALNHERPSNQQLAN